MYAFGYVGLYVRMHMYMCMSVSVYIYIHVCSYECTI